MGGGLAMFRQIIAKNTSLKKHLTASARIVIERKLRDFAAVTVFHFES
jgi:hypothetical protein